MFLFNAMFCQISETCYLLQGDIDLTNYLLKNIDSPECGQWNKEWPAEKLLSLKYRTNS